MYRTVEPITDIFTHKIRSKPPKANYPTNELNIKSVVDIRSIDSIDLNDYDPKNNKECRYNLIVNDKSIKIGLTVSLKKRQDK